ncbi:hypothetical protein GCM10007886_18090 [Methylobacterium gregans]|nr:hypothetical protein GCM10007886_18090 [Methylobacterium gregans]
MKGNALICNGAPLSPPASQGTLPRRGGRESGGVGANENHHCPNRSNSAGTWT